MFVPFKLLPNACSMADSGHLNNKLGPSITSHIYMYIYIYIYMMYIYIYMNTYIHIYYVFEPAIYSFVWSFSSGQL